jgi:transcriptional regulator with PAS, ATPase and Fis domain
LGESGVGKDLIARMIHDASPRKETGELVKVECGAIPEQLFESELFGYETGAFSGARREGKLGYFELANKGTLFLDEIGDLPKSLQAKLLGVLQDHKIRRVGGIEEKKIDVRIVAATNSDLKSLMLAGKFREDLYYRINVVPIIIPPLRERKEDIPFLINHYLNYFNNKYERSLILGNDILNILCDYHWPGNARELRNLIERLVLSAQKNVLSPRDLPEDYRMQDDKVKPSTASWLKEEVQRYELQLVKSVLSQSSSLEEAASKLGISVSSLMRRKRRITNSQ